MKHITIIGAGASGLACAVSCSQALAQCGVSDRVRVRVLEAGPKPGRSIMASGNGRCNYSNARIGVEPAAACGYHNPAFVDQAHEAASKALMPSAAGWLAEQGLVGEEKAGTGGLLYPFSNKARSVLDVLLAGCGDRGVEIVPFARVDRVEAIAAHAGEPASGAPFRFVVSGQVGQPHDASAGKGSARSLGRSSRAHAAAGQGGPGRDRPAAQPFRHETDAVVLAVGNALRREGAHERLAPGLPVAPMRMVLGPIRTGKESIRGLDGLRVQARVSIPRSGFSEEGEVLFRTYGISGIVAFNASRHVQPGDALELDLVPAWPLARLEGWLRERASADRSYVFDDTGTGFRSVARVLLGFVETPLAHALARAAGCGMDEPASPAACERLARVLKRLELEAQGVAEDQTCQVMRGGIKVDAIDPATFEARDLPGLFVLGEALDVDGPCGGFNLDWAWCSGMLSGMAVAGAVLEGGRR